MSKREYPFGPPLPVSPLIRAIRWGLLCAGIVYGLGKQQVYSIIEARWRVEAEKRRVIREKQKAIEKAKLAKEEAENVKLLETGKLFD